MRTSPPARGRDKERDGDRRAGPCALGRRACTGREGGGGGAVSRGRGWLPAWARLRGNAAHWTTRP